MTVQHEPARNRFSAQTDDGTAELAYEMRGDAIAFVHTFVPEAARGQDVGSALAKAGLTHARENGLTVIPACPFIAAYVESHPEYQPLVAGE